MQGGNNTSAVVSEKTEDADSVTEEADNRTDYFKSSTDQCTERDGHNLWVVEVDTRHWVIQSGPLERNEDWLSPTHDHVTPN